MTVESEGDPTPPGAHQVVLGVSSEASIASAFGALDELHAVVNNAGIGVPGPLADVAEVIAEALTTDKPDTRYVGGAGKLATALRPLIPDRLADKLGERSA